MSEQITTPEALDALAEVIFTGWTGYNYKPWKGPNDARDEDWQSALSAASAVLLYHPDHPSDLAGLQAGTEGIVPEDTAEYGIGAGPDAPGPDEVTCLNCGRLAIEHSRGRGSVYGTCPSAADDVKARALVAVRQVLPLDADAMWDATAQATIAALAAAGLLARWDALARAKAEALREAADDVRGDMALAWGSDRPWITTGTKVANLVSDVLRDRAAQIDPTEGKTP